MLHCLNIVSCLDIGNAMMEKREENGCLQGFADKLSRKVLFRSSHVINAFSEENHIFFFLKPCLENIPVYVWIRPQQNEALVKVTGHYCAFPALTNCTVCWEYGLLGINASQATLWSNATVM